MASASAADGFAVAAWLHHLSGFVARHPRLWRRLGDLETRLLAETVAEVEIRAPVYVTGLARAGSTLLLELLAWQGSLATHRYRDFPLLHVPYAWNRFLERVPRRAAPPVERSHRDGIFVTPESPEAFEEVLWMAFFPQLHDPGTCAVLDGRATQPEFEAFYRDHLRKLIRVRGAERYLSKANYNLTRLEYLQRLFPDARFVVPLRDPVWHVASLMKQHRLISAGQRRHPRALAHMQRAGHFEFGLDRRPINAGDREAVREIERLWAAGREVEGWARYWAHLHGFLADRLAANPALRAAVHLVRFDALCAAPAAEVQALYAHCQLPASPDLIARAVARIGQPRYYTPDFTPAECALIADCTAEPAARLGLGSDEPASRVVH